MCQPLGGEEPYTHGVHERVRLVRVVEDRLAADRRDADAVAVVPDPADGAVEVEAGGAEAEPVEQRDRACAHGDDVAEDPADTGRRSLEGLDRGGMVVALNLERACEAVAEVDDPCVLTRSLQHRRPFGREARKQRRRVLVPAMLGPQEREDAQLEVVRVAPEKTPDMVELPVCEAERAVERLFRHGAQGRAPL